jgi:sterol desaturase/sphingolipid hydroxylase (fatty acid hydroxylase superfamily)
MISDLPKPVDFAVPLFVAAILVEMWLTARRNRAAYEPRDTLTSLMLGFGNTVAGALTAGAAGAIALWAFEYRVASIGWAWWAWIAAFVAYDLSYYWAHRAGHRIRWFWASHVIHHSSQHYNLSTALRQTWTGFIGLSFIFSLPLFLLGFHPVMIAFCAGLNLIYQFWIHTEAIDRMPRWFEWLLNTPSHHRVHHATNPRYLDANYAGVFMLWDRMFGSFTPEDDVDPIRYGLVRQLGSFNVLWAATHEWVSIIRDLWHAPWRAKLGYVVMPPGWSHDGSRDTSDSIKARWRAREDASRQPQEAVPEAAE